MRCTEQLAQFIFSLMDRGIRPRSIKMTFHQWQQLRIDLIMDQHPEKATALKHSGHYKRFMGIPIEITDGEP